MPTPTDAAGSSPAPRDTTLLLLTRLHRGDRAAIGELMRRDLAWMQSYVHARLHGVVQQRADTNDIVNDVFARLLERGPRFVVQSRELFRRLMGRILTNAIVSIARRYGAQARAAARERPIAADSVLYLQPDLPHTAVASPAQQAAEAEETAWVRLAMELLSPLDREVLELRGHGVKFAEIGQRVGLTEDAARIRFGRAVPRLRACVDRIRCGQVHDLLDELESQGAG